MNNEPVAWMNSKGDIILPAMQANKEYNIPLYTHPVKELTKHIRKLETALQGWEIGFEKMGYERLLKDKDEHIAELFKESVKELTDEEIKLEAKYFCHSWHSQNPERLVLFARAIMKRCGIISGTDK